MKKTIAITLSIIVIMSACLTACSSKNNEETTKGLEAANNDVGFETVEVTDEDGKKVTDKSGEVVTTEVNVEYVTDKKGNTIAKVLNEKGEPVTDKKGKEVTVKSDYKVTTKADSKKTTTAPADQAPTQPETEKPTSSTTMPTSKGEVTTEKELTTINSNKDKVPPTSSKGTPVTFSSEDQQTIKNMLEVPYLYLSSYENADGVPIDIASHAAIWMARREGLTTSAFASGTIVLDLFKYFGQTVVNFKSKCNEESKNSNIVYVSKTDTFSISNYEAQTHTVAIESIEDLGNNNYYKVTAKVTGAKGINSVAVIIQKNKLDATLGFSIKALKWS